MSNIFRKRRYGYIFLVVIVILGAAYAVYQISANARYNDPDFKAYVKGRKYCDQFFGGNTETTAELYHDYKINHGMIGC